MITNRHLEYIVSVLFIVLGTYIISQAVGYGYVDRGAPLAGFFPFWVGMGMVVLSLINITQLHRAQFHTQEISLSEMGKVALASVLMIAFILSSLYFGMVISAFFLMVSIGILFGTGGKRFYIMLTAISVAMTVFLFIVFKQLLQVPLL
ncbi:tripartite tricarboxylate transporter TctB family protein [Advenella kashmirensis]